MIKPVLLALVCAAPVCLSSAQMQHAGLIAASNQEKTPDLSVV
jgi:hypothetical protein